VPNGRLITIEGVDGAGKSTLAEALAASLRERGVVVAVLREPGGAPLAERIRELLQDTEGTPSARAEALLYAAARAQLVQAKLEPLLAQGTWVVLDRFTDSSLAYQGAGRGLGVDRVRDLNDFATGGLAPDRTLYLRVPAATGRARQGARAQSPDRMELEDASFFARVAAAYDELAREEPERICAIDAERDAERVLEDALAAIDDLLAPAGTPSAHEH
jgi:dTMP kinase